MTLTIIAEIASAHEGEPERAIRLLDLAAGTGADAVKLQIFRRELLLSPAHPKWPNFGLIEMPPEAWRAILAHAGRLGPTVVIEPYDLPSLELAVQSGVAGAYKLPTSELANPALLAAVATTGKPVYLGVGGASEEEIAAALDILDARSSGPVVLLHGIQSYPTALTDMHLARLGTLKARFGRALGFADHVDGGDHELARLIPAMAVAAGATVIEKHITDERARKGRDHHSALDPQPFADFVTFLRAVAAAMGSPSLDLVEAEITYRHQFKRQAVCARPLKAGEALTPEAVTYKRTGRPGLVAADIALLAGRRLKVSLETDAPLTLEDLA